MSILKGYTGCSEEEIRAMSKKDLQDAVIRAFGVKSYKFTDSDSWTGVFMIPDEIADAFRGRA